jgi:hypothetical protein
MHAPPVVSRLSGFSDKRRVVRLLLVFRCSALRPVDTFGTTMASADFCRITPDIAARCAVVVLDVLCRFALLWPRWTVTLARVDWVSAQPIGRFYVQHSHRECGRPPQVRTRCFSVQAPHLPCLLNRWALSSRANSPRRLGLICGFCSSPHTFALRLPPDKSSQACPCRRLVVTIATTWWLFRFSHRGLPPHYIAPMLGAHNRPPY